MSNQTKFSVIIPLYNKEKYICRAIDSVLNQSIQDFELIIINDGSTDNSQMIVEKYSDPRIKLINQTNQGVSAARNKGILEAKEEYIAFFDADDAWEKNFLSIILCLIINYPEAGVYATAYKVKEPSGELKKYDYLPLPSYPWQGIIDNYFDCLVQGSYPLSSSTTCIKKDVFEKAGYFNGSLSVGEDIDMWIRMFLVAKVVFSSEIGAIYYRDAENRSIEVSNFNQKELEFLIHINTYLKNTYMNDQYKKFFKIFVSKKLYAIIIRYINNRQKKCAFKTIVKCINMFTCQHLLYSLLRLTIPQNIIGKERGK